MTPGPFEIQRGRRFRPWDHQPEVVYVPVPAVPAPTSPSPSASGSGPSASIETGDARATYERVVPSPPSTPPAFVVSDAHAIVDVADLHSGLSETDRKRIDGAAEFAREMVILSEKADRADVAWNRYVAGCHLEVLSVSAGAFAGGRDWFGFAWASATASRPTEACAEAGTFFALVDQVKDGMCVAEERARRASVYPGIRRELRTKYRLDWDGWDRVCR